MNGEHENAIEFVEAGENPSKANQSTKQPLDLVASFLQLLSKFRSTQASAFRRHDGKDFKREFQLACFIAFIGFVRPFPTPIYKDSQQLPSLRRITGLTRRKREGHGCSGVGSNHVNFGCPTCARFSNRFWTVVFNAPVLSGCTLTAVLSSET